MHFITIETKASLSLK